MVLKFESQAKEDYFSQDIIEGSHPENPVLQIIVSIFELSSIHSQTVAIMKFCFAFILY